MRRFDVIIILLSRRYITTSIIGPSTDMPLLLYTRPPIGRPCAADMGLSGDDMALKSLLL